LAERGYFTAKTGKPFQASQVRNMLRGSEATRDPEIIDPR